MAHQVNSQWWSKAENATVRQELVLLHAAAVELLRHFWSSYPPSTSDDAQKNMRINNALVSMLRRIDDICAKNDDRTASVIMSDQSDFDGILQVLVALRQSILHATQQHQ